MLNDPKLRKLLFFAISPIIFVLGFIVIPILTSGNTASLNGGAGQMLLLAVLVGAVLLSAMFFLIVWIAKAATKIKAPSSSDAPTTQPQAAVNTKVLYNVAWILIALTAAHLVLDHFEINQLGSLSLSFIKGMLSLTSLGIIFAFAIGLNGVFKEKITRDRVQAGAIFIAASICWLFTFNL